MRLHEYMHYFTARQLGLEASFRSAKAHVENANRWEHLTVTLTPTIATLFMFALSLLGLRADFFLFKLIFFFTTIITGVMLAMCAKDWRDAALTLVRPYESEGSPTLLVISRLPAYAQEQVSEGLRALGYLPTWAGSGKEIRQALSWQSYDLIVVDGALDESQAIAATLGKRRELAQTRITALRPEQDIHRLDEYLEMGLGGGR
jgi:CheY-like chemotaxis protein